MRALLEGELEPGTRLGAFRADEAAIARRVEELLDLFNLRRFRDAPAKSSAASPSRPGAM